MKTLIIDNVDSFVHILYQYVGMCKGNPQIVYNNISKKELDEIMQGGVEKIVISPGPGHPKDAGISNHILKTYSQDIATLGVCLGHQCIGHVFGAKIRGADSLMPGKTSEIEHRDSVIFSGIPKRFEATRYHSLVVDDLPDCLLETARSLDHPEIMAIEHEEHPIFGVQFHPESILTEQGMRIIKNFMRL
jgi:anthranilate synthase/aminodeoxychorismate synthase-like glutamine amidotransferase